MTWPYGGEKYLLNEYSCEQVLCYDLYLLHDICYYITEVAVYFSPGVFVLFFCAIDRH